MRVIGTAGHVDHGKSTLVLALTGTHPDRLKEEQEREMTIDLGFAWLPLPPGDELPDTSEIGIVDVPGHRDFIENMLAGIGGIDAALFVVAADEGVMPQTREHLAILDLLQINGGVVALTKIDMIDEEQWLDLVEDELHQVMKGTVLAEAPIVRVSGRTRAGVPELVQALVACLRDRAPRPDYGRPRLPVDRVFTMAGFGTVVTGTLSDGELRVGDEVHILPGELRGRIRGLQSHQRKIQTALPGGRTAVNISGVDVDQIQRGATLTRPGDYKASRRLDVQFRLLADVSLAVKHNMQVKLFLGAAEIPARVRLLGTEVLNPGEDGWLQLDLTTPVVATRGDRYILRRPSPGMTLGGGVVLDPHPLRRHRRFSPELIGRLETLASGNPEEMLVQTAQAIGPVGLDMICQQANLESSQAREILPRVFERGALIFLEEGRPEPMEVALVATPSQWDMLANRLISTVDRYHQSHPLRRGMPKEELRSRLKLPPRIHDAALRHLVSEGELKDAGPLVFRPGHELVFSAEEKRKVDAILAQFEADPYSPPSVKEVIAEVGEEVYAALLQLERLVQVSQDVAFQKDDYDRMVVRIVAMLEKDGAVTVASVRDAFQTSRRYILALLEHLDEIGVTYRDGDFRRKK